MILESKESPGSSVSCPFDVWVWDGLMVCHLVDSVGTGRLDGG